MPSTTNYKFGDVVLVSFPFTHLQSTKKRPAVIVSSTAYCAQRADVIVLAITSRVHQPSGFGESMIEEWERAGLLKLSAFKPLVATIERVGILRTLGQLAARDVSGLHNLLGTILGAPTK